MRKHGWLKIHTSSVIAMHFESETSKYTSILFMDAKAHLSSELIRLYPCTIN